MAQLRETFPDRLRGIALLGIVLVNAPFMGISADGLTAASVSGSLNWLSAFLMLAFAEGKFYLLFSFLFGYSSAFILRDNSTPNRRRYLRRLVALFLFGLVHAIFFFIGDILITYSLLGLLLFAISRSSDQALRWWTRGSIAVAVLLLIAFAALLTLSPDGESSMPGLNQALASGTFLEVAGARLAVLPDVVIFLLFVQAPMAFAAFTLGLRASRIRLLAHPEEHQSLWKRLVIWGWVIGLPLQLIAAYLQMSGITSGTRYTVAEATGLALGFISAPILSAGYVGLLGMIFSRKPGFLVLMAPAGRMSLTVYIGESVLLSLLFCGFGLGFFADWGAFGVVLAGIGSWIVLSLFALLWTKRFSQGPLEVVLARMTGKQNYAT
jgi:uncharacterized protein